MNAVPVPINLSSSGDTVVVAGVSGKYIKVVSFFIVVGDTTNIKFTDGAGGSVLCGQMNFRANGGMVSAHIPMKEDEHWMKTSLGNDLVLNNSATVQVGGILRYYLSSI